MSWSCNQGPSFDNQLHSFQMLNGFYQRFNLRQDDNRMTPGKREVRPEAPTIYKGRKGTQVTPRDNIPKQQPQPIYSSFSNVKNKATTKIQKSGGKLKKRYVRQ